MASPRTPPSGLEPEIDFDRQVLNEKSSVSAPIYSSTEEPSREQHFKVVARGDPLSSSDDVRGEITGYDDSLMRARAALSSTEEKKLLKRIDWHLIPLLAIMYMVKTIDASNVSNARIMDRGTPRNIMIELSVTPDQYNFVTAAYYIPYILAETPSNLLVKYLKPSAWQARIMISWGIVLCCHAAVTNAGGLYTVRAFLGLFEAGLWPGILLQLCYWYRPDEMASRIVLVTLLGNFSAVISGVLSFAFDGVHARGLSGWKWLILTEGVFTIILGIVVYLVLPDFPNTASWMSQEEKDFIQARLPINAPRAAEKDFDWKEFWQTLKDPKLWLFLLCWAFYTIGTTGLQFYQPTVIANLGFTTIAQAQLLNIPPAIFACVLTIVFGWVANTGHVPLPAIPLAFMVIIEACYVVLYTFPNTGGVYAATVIAGGFSIAWYTMMWPWRVQTTDGATGSAFAIAFANSYGQIGGAVGSQLFNSRAAIQMVQRTPEPIVGIPSGRDTEELPSAAEFAQDLDLDLNFQEDDFFTWMQEQVEDTDDAWATTDPFLSTSPSETLGLQASATNTVGEPSASATPLQTLGASIPPKSAHQHHPYATTEDLERLQGQTGLSRQQVTNWLVNARRRSKPHSSRTQSSYIRDATQSTSTGPGTINIPRRPPTPMPCDQMSPLQRWQNSPPECEPATVASISRAIAASPKPGPFSPLSGRSSDNASSVSSAGNSHSSRGSGSCTSAHSYSSGGSLKILTRHAGRRRRRRAPKRQGPLQPSLFHTYHKYQCLDVASAARLYRPGPYELTI
ncbi:hypothetical protein Neosp_009984 [[Neocosmospora] mangrovei]